MTPRPPLRPPGEPAPGVKPGPNDGYVFREAATRLAAFADDPQDGAARVSLEQVLLWAGHDSADVWGRFDLVPQSLCRALIDAVVSFLLAPGDPAVRAHLVERLGGNVAWRSRVAAVLADLGKGRAGDPGKGSPDPPAPDPARPDDLRAAGWAVAAHNDYRVGGRPHTFWLFTRNGCAVKGEGETDAIALDRARLEAGLPSLVPVHPPGGA